MAFNAGAVRATLELGINPFKRGLQAGGNALTQFRRRLRNVREGLQRFRQALAVVRDLVIVLPAAFRVVSAPLRAIVNQLSAASDRAASFNREVTSLGTALRLRGVQNVEAFTASFKDFASAIQDATEFGDKEVVQVGSLLTTFGAAPETLKESTQATLDFAAAVGIDAATAARAFGQTLGGTIGTAGRYLPALRNLTTEQLKAGEAFNLVRQLVGGFAEELGTTTIGIRKQFANAVEDLQKAIGFAINPVLNRITQAGTAAVKLITNIITEESGSIEGGFAKLADALLEDLSQFAAAALNVAATFAETRATLVAAVGFVRVTFTELTLLAKQFVVDTQEALLPLSATLDALGLINGEEGFKAFEKLKEEIAVGRVEAQKLREEMERSTREADDFAQGIRRAVEDIKSGKDESSAVARAYNTVQENIGKAREQLQAFAAEQEKTKRGAEAVKQNVVETNRAMKQRLDRLREINGVSFDSADATKQIADAADQAASNTERLAAAADSANQSLSGAASSASAAAAASGTFVGPGASRTRGGSLGLTGGTASQTAANLSALQQNLSRVGGIFGRAQRQSGRAVVNQLAGVLRGQIAEETQAFTSGIIAELNRQGIFDPDQRQQVIQTRLAEARRLGVITTAPSSIGGFTGGGLG